MKEEVHTMCTVSERGGTVESSVGAQVKEGPRGNYCFSPNARSWHNFTPLGRTSWLQCEELNTMAKSTMCYVQCCYVQCYKMTD